MSCSYEHKMFYNLSYLKNIIRAKKILSAVLNKKIASRNLSVFDIKELTNFMLSFLNNNFRAWYVFGTCDRFIHALLN